MLKVGSTREVRLTAENTLQEETKAFKAAGKYFLNCARKKYFILIPTNYLYEFYVMLKSR